MNNVIRIAFLLNKYIIFLINQKESQIDYQSNKVITIELERTMRIFTNKMWSSLIHGDKKKRKKKTSNLQNYRS